MRRPLIRNLAPLLTTILALGACSGDNGSGASKDAPWVGKTYVLTIPSANWTQPPNIGGDIGAFVPQFIVGIGPSSGDTLTVTLGTGTGGTQDMCSPTTQVTANGGGYPDIAITAPAFPMRIVNPTSHVVVNTTVQKLTLTNVLPGSAPAKDGILTASVDISELFPLFNQIPDSARTKDGVCQQLGSFGAPCGPCPTTGLPYCLNLAAVQLGATASATALVQVSSAQIPVSCSVVDAGAAADAASGAQTVDSGAAADAGAGPDGTSAATGADGATGADAAVADAAVADAAVADAAVADATVADATVADAAVADARSDAP
jgi:hypothetical protein